MKEARLIVPEADNDGKPADHVLTTVRTLLAQQFGGFTETPGHGGWLSPTGKLYAEPVRVFDVALPDDKPHMDALRGIARVVLARLDQEAVYLRAPSGDVEFVSTATAQEAA